jgi:hypothetical protein
VTGWASCNRAQTEAEYKHSCGTLEVGDVCVPPAHSQPPLHLRDSDQSQVHKLEYASVVALSEMAQVGHNMCTVGHDSCTAKPVSQGHTRGKK